MLTPGDVVELDLGVPTGSGAGLRQGRVDDLRLRRDQPVAQRHLAARSSAQCQHVRSVATARIRERTGNVGPVALDEVRETLALLLDL